MSIAPATRPASPRSDCQLDLTTGKLLEHLDRTPFRFDHSLEDHDLLQWDQLAELADRLPAEQREYVFARQEFGTREGTDFVHAGAQDQLSTAEMIDSIASKNCIVVLRNVETDPVYGEFVHDMLNWVTAGLADLGHPASYREAFIFISPPLAYTPFHYDPEQNLFMQIRGDKEMAIYDPRDRELVTEEALEVFYGEDHRILEIAPEQFQKFESYRLKPGEGVYVPVTAPHWVRTGDQVSLSMSINFRTPGSIRRSRAYRWNYRVRRMGLSPRRVSFRGESGSDRLKSAVLELPARVKRLWQR